LPSAKADRVKTDLLILSFRLHSTSSWLHCWQRISLTPALRL